jgi:Helix-turn-helix domain
VRRVQAGRVHDSVRPGHHRAQQPVIPQVPDHGCVRPRPAVQPDHVRAVCPQQLHQGPAQLPGAAGNHDLVRRANRRLAVLQHAEEVSGSVAATCRYYRISRTVFYRWKRRYEDEGFDGLKDRSSAPMH